MFSYPWSTLMSWLSVVLVFSVSGQNVLEMAKEAGADITDAVNKCVASTSKETHNNKLAFRLHFKQVKQTYVFFYEAHFFNPMTLRSYKCYSVWKCGNCGLVLSLAFLKSHTTLCSLVLNIVLKYVCMYWSHYYGSVITFFICLLTPKEI